MFITAVERDVLRAVDQHGDPYKARQASHPLVFDATVRRLVHKGLLRTVTVTVSHAPFNTLALTPAGVDAITRKGMPA